MMGKNMDILCTEFENTLRTLWLVTEGIASECDGGDAVAAKIFASRVESAYLPALYHLHSSLQDLQERMEKAL